MQHANGFMGSGEINIVVVDHQTFGETLAKHLKKAGFNPILTRKPSDAMREFGVKSVHAFIIECVLPGSSGVNLAKSLRETGASKVPFYFMCGLFKSQSFVKKTLADSGGEAFFEKPLNYEQIVKTLKEKFKIQSESQGNNSIISLVVNKKIDDRNCLEILRSTNKVYGYDIPSLISTISRTNIMGIARFSSKNSMAKVYISKGRVISVLSNDTNSYWGALLLEKNLITPEELKVNLSKSISDKKKIGTRLIEANLISPHIVDLISLEQARIRIGRMINDTRYSFNFTDFNVSQTDSMHRCHSEYMSNKFLSEWTYLKTPIEFLRQTYILYLQHKVIKSSNYKNRNEILSVPYVSHDAELLNNISERDCLLSELLSSKDNQEIYRLIHYLVVTDVITFKRNNSVENFESRIEVLNKFKKDIEKQNYFQIMGVNEGKDFDEYSLKSSYISLTKSFHPDRLVDAPKNLKMISNEIFNIISEAYNTLLNPEKREQYESNIESAKADIKLSLDNLLSDAKVKLKNYKATEAYDLLQQAVKLQKPSTETKLYLLWAKIAKADNEIKQEDIMDILETLNRIPVEDRNTALYYFVKGLLQKKIGDYDLSELNFKKAILFDDKFIIARSELKKVDKLKKTKSISVRLGSAKQQLKDMFFKEKQKKAS